VIFENEIKCNSIKNQNQSDASFLNSVVKITIQDKATDDCEEFGLLIPRKNEIKFSMEEMGNCFDIYALF